MKSRPGQHSSARGARELSGRSARALGGASAAIVESIRARSIIAAGSIAAGSIISCTAAGEFEPTLVGAEAAGGRGAGSAATAEGQPTVGITGPTPMIESGNTDSPLDLLPDGTSEDNAGSPRSGSEAPDAPVDAGLDASRGSDGGAVSSGEADAGPAPVDAGSPPTAPDASPPPPAPDAGSPPVTDPCPGLVFEQSCYEFFDEHVSWHEGEARCSAWGGHLASVESSEEDAFLGAWPALLGVPLLDGSGLWLGGTDARREGDFRWYDDRPLGFTGWAADQPNNGAGLDCIEKRNDAARAWYDRRCTDGERYVCERPE